MYSQDGKYKSKTNTINLLFSSEASFNGEVECTIEITMQLTNISLTHMSLYSVGVAAPNLVNY